MKMNRWSVAVIAVACAASSGACKRATAVAFQPKTPIVIETDKGVKVPDVVALDSSGAPLKDAPSVAYTSDPIGIISVEAGRVMPLKNGDATLKANAENLTPAEVPVHVAVVDDVRINCPAPCAPHIGETIALEVSAVGLGQKITKGITWASSDPLKATVDADGKVSALAAGPTTITATLGKKVGEVKIDVHPAVDEVRLFCPWPPLVAFVKRGETPGASDRSCEVLEGDDVKLDALTLSHGEVVEGERIDWHASDPSVRVVAGTVTGDHPGGAMVEVHAADLVAEMPVSVVAAKSKGLGFGHCSTSEAAFDQHFAVTLALKSMTGETSNDFGYRCETAGAKKCVDDAAKEIAHAVEKLALDNKALGTFGIHALDERARRCCCRR